jgi:inhibitor of KinA
MEITPLGDSALLIRVAENFDDAPEDALNKVLAAQRKLEAIQIPGVIEIAPAYTTVAMFYHPARVVDGGAPANDVVGWLEERIRKALSNTPTDASPAEGRSPIEIPVCYDPEFGFDLEDVAHRANIDSKQVIELHSGAEYRVHCLGFTGGFTFLGGLPKKLATPRRDIPRKEIPAGSVAIGGKQTGIYPIRSPGGWNVIGRTQLKLFDPKNNPPTLLRAGDRVRFRAISRDEFEKSTS